MFATCACERLMGAKPSPCRIHASKKVSEGLALSFVMLKFIVTKDGGNGEAALKRVGTILAFKLLWHDFCSVKIFPV